MKFEEIYIDGFGIFHNYQIKNLTPGLTIFIGPNEAGKSTILSKSESSSVFLTDAVDSIFIHPLLVAITAVD